jgi:hypothetical protein
MPCVHFKCIKECVSRWVIEHASQDKVWGLGTTTILVSKLPQHSLLLLVSGNLSFRGNLPQFLFCTYLSVAPKTFWVNLDTTAFIRRPHLFYKQLPRKLVAKFAANLTSCHHSPYYITYTRTVAGVRRADIVYRSQNLVQSLVLHSPYQFPHPYSNSCWPQS